MPVKAKAKASEKAAKKASATKKGNSQKDEAEKPQKETPTTDEKMMTDEEAAKKDDKTNDNEETKEPAADEEEQTENLENQKDTDNAENKVSLNEKREPKQVSQLKDLVLQFLYQKEQISEEYKNYKKDALVFEIYETFPLFLVHDGCFFINCVFSDEAWATLKKQVADNN